MLVRRRGRLRLPKPGAFELRSANDLFAAAVGRFRLLPVHPQMLRHSCRFDLANRGYDLRLIRDDLGHCDPRHTVQVARIAGSRFERVWS